MRVKVMLLVLFLPGQVFAGKFNCGTLNATSDQVTLPIPRPPDAYPQIKTIRVEVVEADKNFTDHARLRMQIEQALARDFSVDKTKGDALLRVSVVAYDAPTVGLTRQMETRPVEVSRGRAEMQQVPVTYWVGKGRITLRVQMVDAEGAPMDSFDPQEVYSETREVGVSGRPVAAKTTSSWIPRVGVPHIGGKPKTAENKEPGPATTAPEVNAAMLDSIAAQIRRRYVRTVDQVQFKLGCDDELRTGNKLVTDGTPDWEKAIKAWEGAQLKKNEGDRNYNIAVAYEALAYKAYEATLNPADAVPFFDKAMGMYDQASKADPDEKYIRSSADRLKLARTNITRALDQRKAWEAERDHAREAFVSQREGQKALTIQRTDSQAESGFRTFVRMNLAADAKKDLAPLKAAGEKMGLDEQGIQRIFYQEAERAKGLGAYEEFLKLAVADGVVTKEERAALEMFYKTQGMSAEDAKGVEKKFKFTEQGAAAPPPPAPAPVVVPPAAKAPAAAVKTPVAPAKK